MVLRAKELESTTPVKGRPEGPRRGGEAWPPRPHVGAARGAAALNGCGAPQDYLNKVHCLSVGRDNLRRAHFCRTLEKSK